LSRGKIVFHGDRESLLSSPQILANVFGVSFRKTRIDGIGEILLPVYSY